ncbi:hypothetical protein DYB35_011973 [Aphanomyces astaci]|uniref:Uncharacterized protein n=1 Tax=Aphanomyces astaci TaxID=112090 RepID=A0A397F9N4_APHAT|nr:hypothetical protein DYB35_011973 [Aphanomyces astaci]RHZ15222.1 hypothetical protein DYB31_009815 [Aphanomyces astaci]
MTNSQRRVDMEEMDRVNKRLEGHIAAIERSGLWYHAEEQSLLEYLRLFEHGYTQSPRQDTFLQNFIEPDSWCNGHRGLDALLLHWTNYTTAFTSFHIKCVQLNPVSHSRDEVIVDMRCMAELGLSLQSIRTVFPHVLHRQDLVEKMLTAPLRLHVHATYMFDDNKQVTWQASNSNLVDALFRQFGNLEDVAVAASNSGILPNGMIRSDPARPTV